jgi:dihydropyrimidinase
MSSRAAVKHVRKAQGRQLPVYAETCPHYLLLRSDRLQAPNFEGSKWVCSPPLRHDDEDLEAMWQALDNGTFTVVSSDHCPDFFDHPCGKKAGIVDGKPRFTKIPNGMPGVETRLPLLFSHSGDRPGDRISLSRFVALTSTNPAKLYGLDKQKGSIVPGLDADIVVWYPEGHRFSEESADFTITQEKLHHRVDYTPFEGHRVKNWPRWVFLRGKLAWDKDNGGVIGNKTDGLFLKRGKSSLQSRKINNQSLGMASHEKDLWL